MHVQITTGLYEIGTQYMCFSLDKPFVVVVLLKSLILQPNITSPSLETVVLKMLLQAHLTSTFHKFKVEKQHWECKP